MIRVERIDIAGTAHEVTVRTHRLTTDMGPDGGGTDAGPDPHDLYDAALGSCKALTMLWYAERNGMALENVAVSVHRDASGERQGVYKLRTEIAVTGPISDAQRARLLEVAAKCPVHKLMTNVTTEIETVDVSA